MAGDYQNNLEELPKLNEFRYENLFKVYKQDQYYYYNIINSINFEEDIDEEFFYEWECDKRLAWTQISYIHYNTIFLWWLICSVNRILNPIPLVENGKKLKIIKPEYVRTILDRILSKINE